MYSQRKKFKIQIGETSRATTKDQLIKDQHNLRIAYAVYLCKQETFNNKK